MRRRIEDLVPLERVAELFDCDAEAGRLTWRERPITNWRLIAWNKRFAGKDAGNHNTGGHIQIGIKIDGVKYYVLAHRLIWAIIAGEWIPTTLEVDHRNRIRDDNRLTNLRVCLPEENLRNKSIYANNTSGFKGVSWVPKIGKWLVLISLNRRNISVGYFTELKDAVEAYDAAAMKIFGDFAATNFDLGRVA